MEAKTFLLSLLLLPVIGGVGSYLIPLTQRKYLSVSFVMLVSTLLVLSQIGAFVAPISYSYVWIRGFNLNFQADKLSLILCGLVTSISFLVSIFSARYLQKDKSIDRFFVLLGFFIASMLGVFLANDLVVLFIFWEFVGVSSFLLIGYWYAEAEKANAARIAFLTNRVADLFLLSGIILLYHYFGSFSFSEFSRMPGDDAWLGLACAGIVIGAMGKSAQFPFFTWLPHAMAGPTPISALIHAATMVTAGVYLLLRMHPFFPEEVRLVILWVGGITLLIGALSAMFQHDIKKILAYSTISQLGYMFMAAGFDSTYFAVSHLLSHAFFKAGLFLTAAVLIEYMHQKLDHEKSQDIRRMGGLRRDFPVIFITTLILASSLAAVPLTSGFITKENILMGLYEMTRLNPSIGMFLLVSTSISGIITAFYSGRMLSAVFLGDAKYSINVVPHAWKYSIPIFVCSGWSLFWILSYNPFSHHVWMVDWMGIENGIKSTHASIYLTSVLSTVVFVLSIWLYGSKYRATVFEWEDNSWVAILKNGFFLNRIYQRQLAPNFYLAGKISALFERKIIDRLVRLLAVIGVLLGKLADLMDKLLIDGGVKLIAWLTGFTGWITTRMNGSRVQSQILWALFGLVVLLWWFNEWMLV